MSIDVGPNHEGTEDAATAPSGSTRSENELSAGFTLIAGICFVLLCGMLFGASLWILAAVAAGAVLYANKFMAQTWTRSVIATRNAPDDELKVGDTMTVTVELTNTGRLPVFWVLAEDLLPRWTTTSDLSLIHI